jgi:hypothetical protein
MIIIPKPTRKKKGNKLDDKGEYVEIIIESKPFGTIRTKIDKDDIDKVCAQTWAVYNSNGHALYAITRWRERDGTMGGCSLHRYIMNPPDGYIVDHINFDTLDNRKSNLRVVDSVFSNVYRREFRNNKSGHKNVHWCKSHKRWKVYFRCKNHGSFIDKNEAIEHAKIVRDDYFNSVMLNKKTTTKE